MIRTENSSSLSSRSYVCFFIFFPFIIRCWTFDIHSFRSLPYKNTLALMGSLLHPCHKSRFLPVLLPYRLWDMCSHQPGNGADQIKLANYSLKNSTGFSSSWYGKDVTITQCRNGDKTIIHKRRRLSCAMALCNIKWPRMNHLNESICVEPHCCHE